MPELPDVNLYIERIAALFGGRSLTTLAIYHPFLLRSVGVSPKELDGRSLLGTERVGKRIVLAFEGSRLAVIHLMIAGRFHLQPVKANPARPPRNVLCRFVFGDTALTLTEAGTKRRASLHLLSERSQLAEHDRGGVEPLVASLREFKDSLRQENRTLKRALTDPRLLSGVGNAYSDEILHAAHLSPVTRTHSLGDAEWQRLYAATQSVLRLWVDRLREECGAGFPEKVTAFRPDMAAHGKFGQPCPACGTKIQRIRHADNEINYCPECQTGGKLLRDRSLSRLLQADWPKTLEELEELRAGLKT
jgi:formamidopyrimidine-DNA glycosylase